MIREETRYMTDGKHPASGNPVLLSQAIGDAIAWRLHDGRPCPCCADALCGPCDADLLLAERHARDPPQCPVTSPLSSDLLRSLGALILA